MSVHQAVRTPADINMSGWYGLLPPPKAPEVLRGRHTADWVIVGAGFSGLAAARRLSQLVPGDRIVLIDAQRVGWGAAGRNSGFMIDLPHELGGDNYGGSQNHDRKRIRMNRAAIEFSASAADEYGLQRFFVRAGKFHGAATDRGLAVLREFEDHLTGLDEPFERLDAPQLKKITGTDFFVGGTFTPGTVMAQPAGFVRGVAEGLSSRVRIFEKSAVTSVQTGKLHTVKTTEGEITTPRLILTVNGHLESFGFFKKRLLHVFTYASMTRPLAKSEQATLGGEPHWGLIPADPMGSTIRRIGDRIVVRNTFTYNPNMSTSEKQIDQIGDAHDRSFRARFPMLGEIPMEYRWGGHLCLSLNSAPAFGEIEERVFVAGCCNGLGTVQGTLYGMLAADLAAGSDEPMIADALNEPAPTRLYPEPLMSIGAPLKLWAMQKRAGKEL
ncbi:MULTISPECIES: FAD-binding oxidoreductase [unclassified Mesorhizobium]|uniref:NAD(P)/FAD-dependent oxidoreductase n=1 Tax=unclassified Mesorhizobium TaxID=325217 RepID=UPI000BB09FD6|nr:MULTISPECIES: FAD-binding oxidoreductase [unclassified Mesorhizobium]TGT58564.1 FAD-binding oxidoreductase [Mesorhizobium sp. M00.F.Ca.ET.170.01.1.1]AZO12029.1 FAD-binding oxidoreductase [Mesorhizobium sp. M3A.F.Ca.ET.080.04.2.1]PBB84318.1 FAD-dependent oxidoreductase [Mesorhizobium sp. WSM3876]RWB74746.1 MAG: FAD-binding oxidoreductase [Mesorhizobium sp.]RWB89796.1 MAG: FAD-binding oxidoreductase [Mesorhizobium sp.]